MALHAAVVLFGFAALFGKWLALSPTLIVLGRTGIAAIALALIRPRVQDFRRPMNLRLLATGAVLALHWVAFFAAIQLSSVAMALLGFAAFPLFTLLLERVVLRTRWKRRDAITSALVVAGLALVVPHWSWADASVRGLCLGVLAALTFALLAVMNRRHAGTRSALEIALWQNVGAALCLLPFAWMELAGASISGADWMLLIALGLFCTALAHTLFITSLRVLTAHVASVVAALEPVYGMVLAWALLSEVPGPRMWAGAALLVLAAISVARAPSAHLRTAVPLP
ncbi:MAG: DMT family transporter [Pseudomonadota bacterium]|nr:DMT family transporter [Pseudomonadota bacterium]